MHQLLRKFLEEWLAWVDSGAGKHSIFDTDLALCDNLAGWYVGRDSDLLYLKNQLKAMFEADGLHPRYPFNRGLIGKFTAEIGRHHLNEERVAWVRRKLS